MKIAVIGSGISGLVACWLLQKNHDVTIFEKSKDIGLSNHKVLVDDLGSQYRIDIPVRTISGSYYESLNQIIDYFGVETVEVPRNSNFLDHDTGVTLLHAQKYTLGGLSIPMVSVRDLHKLPRWKTFFRLKRLIHDITTHPSGDLSIDEFLSQRSEHIDLYNKVVLPQMSLTFSCDYDRLRTLPLRYLAAIYSRFGENPDMRLIKGGIDKLSACLINHRETVKYDAEICRVEYDEQNNFVKVVDGNGQSDTFDHVIFAVEGNRVLPMLGDRAEEYRHVFDAFEYQSSTIFVHQDPKVMPQNRRDWASINLSFSKDRPTCMWTVWYNKFLQWPKSLPNYFQTWNPFTELEPAHILSRVTVSRSMISRQATEASAKLEKIQGKNNLWFCGAYSMDGLQLLENGARSSVGIAKQLGTSIPWEQASGV